MAEFRYDAKTSSGQKVSGTLVAQNEADAVGELRRQNLVVVSMTEPGATRAPPGGGIRFFSGGAGPKVKVKSQELVIFTRQLATMIAAGIPLLECLEILAEQSDDQGFRVILVQVADDVRAGGDLSESMRKHPGCFVRIYVNMIKAGEASGQLDEILVRLAEYQESTEKLKGEIKAAMTYPVVSLAMIGMITIFLLVFIIPKFKEIFTSLSIELPFITRALLGISDYMKNYWYVWLFSMAGMFVFFLWWKKTDSGEKLYDKFKLSMPVFGPLFRKVAIARFARTFATLIQSGVPILGALEIVASTAGNRVIEDAVMSAVDSVRQGDTLGEPLARSQVFPPMVTRMISIGEKSGALESLLEKIAEFYDQQVSQSVESLTSLIEPLMIGVMGSIVGGIVLAVFLPIFEIQKKVMNR
ncbi:MAG: type II secretion system F family protein [Planctomycetota bacterium]|nr:type II secretion system F family protein [Planctomycetota bacterium]